MTPWRVYNRPAVPLTVGSGPRLAHVSHSTAANCDRAAEPAPTANTADNNTGAGRGLWWSGEPDTAPSGDWWHAGDIMTESG